MFTNVFRIIKFKQIIVSSSNLSRNTQSEPETKKGKIHTGVYPVSLFKHLNMQRFISQEVPISLTTCINWYSPSEMKSSHNMTHVIRLLN